MLTRKISFCDANGRAWREVSVTADTTRELALLTQGELAGVDRVQYPLIFTTTRDDKAEQPAADYTPTFSYELPEVVAPEGFQLIEESLAARMAKRRAK